MSENIKVVIFAGGLGTRLSEETELKPKPMVEIGGKPILWHIMKSYSAYGFNDFVICLGYKGYLIKEYFTNYFLHQSDVTIDLSKNKIEVHNNHSEPWKVTLVDTGLYSMTGARLKKIRNYVGDKTFMLTYGDGVSDIDIKKLLEFHRKHGKLATLSAVQPEGKFGALAVDDNNVVQEFQEKPKGDNTWINGGFFVLEPKIFDYIEDGDQVSWEQEPLRQLSSDRQLMTYKHDGFWKCMDTLNDKRKLNEMWDLGKAPWMQNWR
jgi:glucose-1-phosphate cytidylyltransferase